MTMFSGHWDLVGSKVATVVSLAPCVGGTVSNTRAVAARAMSLDVAIRAASKWIFERFILPILLSPSRGAQPGMFVWFVIVLSSFLIVIVKEVCVVCHRFKLLLDSHRFVLLF